MSGLLTQLLSWKAVLVVAAVFGFAPGAALRLIVLAFPRSDPRRRELLAELRAVPRLERPAWVAEQLEVALAEGMAGRLARVWRRVALGRRLSERWRREKDDFLSAHYTIGYTLATASYFVAFVYIALLVPGIAKGIVCVPWAVLGPALAAAGAWYLVSSSLLWPSGVHIIVISLRMPSSPTVRSAQGPSTCPLPSSSMPSSVKNAAASRSSTTMATLSIR
jgi:hypothetical protein